MSFNNSSDYEKIVSILTADKRKNVSSLGAKIIKDKEKSVMKRNV